ncbi:MAG: tetratricopeptide repeat protein [Limisphaerales bacterium]
MTGQQSSSNVPVEAGWWKQHWRTPVVCLALAAITFAVFGQTVGFGFVNYDDGFYVYQNAKVTGGLSLKGLAWVFTHADCHLYHPLTILSLMEDYQLHGLNAGGYHFTNVLLHTASVILLFLVLRQMTGALWRSAFVAAVFAIHPLRVESVAWVAERKDVLATFFFMLTLGAYARYVRKPESMGRYLMVVIAFVPALLSKPTVVTLPFVLLLLDYWPLRRFEQSRNFSGLVLEKIPLLALAAAACAMTVLGAEKEVAGYANVSTLSRVGNGLVSYVVYLRQMVWPEGLAVFYPRPEKGYPVWTMSLSFLLLALITAGVLAFRRKRGWLLTGWLWYLGMLTPMIGIVQGGAFAHADRMTYLPQIGINVGLTWLAAEWAAKRHLRCMTVWGLMITVLGVLMVCAWKQTVHWQDSEALWTHTLACTTGNHVAHYNLGDDLVQQGRLDEAISQYQEALQIKPDHAEALNNLANALLAMGKPDEAILQYQKALQIKPDYASAHYNLAIVLQQKGRMDEAIIQYQNAVRFKPDNVQAQYSLATALRQQGRVDEAKVHYQKVLQIDPGFEEGLYNLGNDLRQKGRVDEAITQYQEALQINPGYADAHVNLGSALLQTGRLDEAIAHLQKALQINPGSGKAHNNLGNALLQKGNAAEAIAHFQQAMQLEPADPWVKNNLAWLLATSAEAPLRNGAKAVELAAQANGLAGGENPIILHTLAAALAEAGRFSEAAETAQRALDLAESQSDIRLAGQLQPEIKLYQAGRPFHNPAHTQQPQRP